VVQIFEPVHLIKIINENNIFFGKSLFVGFIIVNLEGLEINKSRLLTDSCKSYNKLNLIIFIISTGIRYELGRKIASNLIKA
jgi:hypothetical protein